MTTLPLVRTFTDAQGIDITFYEWPIASPRAAIQLLHGLGEHARRYDELASVLNKAGYAVYATDHRGHGETGLAMVASGASKRMGNLGPGGMTAVFADELQLRDLIETEHMGRPLVLIGHSWGSMIAQRLLDSNSTMWQAAVLTGSTVLLPGILPSGGFNRKWNRTPNKTGFEWLSRDRSVGEAFVADPKTFPDSAISVFGVSQTIKLLGLPKKTIYPQLPMLLMAGSEDPIGGERGTRLLADAYRRAGVVDLQAICYHGARHEVFNETNRLEVFADLLAWLDEKLA
ncbi:MAG: alpha/beta hydrolase [Actinomycetales bacterium]|nr:alpha/beta hydrolase [Actinomycetales bacterium]